MTSDEFFVNVFLLIIFLVGISGILLVVSGLFDLYDYFRNR